MAATLLLTVIPVVPGWAQGPGLYMPYPANADPSAQSQLMMELTRRAHSQGLQKKRGLEEIRHREFSQRVVEFAGAWNDLIASGSKGVWNAKQARAARKAFERLVHTDGWIETK
jgi:hypothetical protein